MNREDFVVELPGSEAIRLDRFVASLGLFTRSQISRRSVRCLDPDGRELKQSRKVRDGDVVTLEWDDPPASEVLPEKIPLDIVYEDSEVLVINKPQGMVVHPAPGHFHGTLVQGLLYRYEHLDREFQGDRVRPGIVHRLDKDTSGLIIAALNMEALAYLSGLFRERSVKKTYLAIVKGVLPAPEGDVNAVIGRDPRDRKKFAVGVRNGKDALSRYRVLARSESYSLVQVRILTGRTHQIRVHMKHLGSPVLGDPIYSRRDPRLPDATLMLHSWKLAIEIRAGERRRFEAPLPGHFLEAMAALDLELPVNSES